MATASSVQRFEALLAEIRHDNTSGAAELTVKAARALRFLFRSMSDVRELRARFPRAARRLIAAQPSMAPILNLVNTVALQISGLAAGSDLKSAMEKEWKRVSAAQKTSPAKVARNFYGLVASGDRVVTYSYSSTVMAALAYARRRGKIFEVICSESRPVGEGIATARRLARTGIRTTLVTDAALLDLIRHADLLVTGADAIIPQGLVNKVGTYGLAVVAKEVHVPFYGLCAEDKLLAESLARLFKVVEKAPQEISARRAKNLQVRNYYFDATPFPYLSGLVTDKRILRAAMIPRVLKSLPAAAILT